jgi:O-methyltransferase domain
MSSIVGSLWRRLAAIVNPPRYQSPFFVFAQIQLARAYYVAAQLQIAELVRERPRSAEELAAATGSDRDSLYRHLRLLAAFGVFAEDSAGKFCLTKRARLLLADEPGSLRPWILFEGQPELWQGYAHTLEAVKSGIPAFELANSMSYYQCVAERPTLAAAFYGALANWGDIHCQAVLAAFDFGRFAHVIDVGGGQGRLVELLLRANPHVHATLFDLADTIRQARERLATAGFGERCQFLAGSFFESVPSGADLYIVRDVLGDWNDEQAVQILATCRRAMKPEATLLISDTVIDPRNGRDRIAKLLDVQKASLMLGRKRTRAEFEALLDRAGLSLAAIHPTAVVDVQLLEAKIVSNRSS